MTSSPLQQQPYDAIITLGGGSQRGPHCSDLPLWVVRRLELAAHLFRNQQQNVSSSSSSSSSASSPKIICLSAGTPHRPNWIDAESGFPVLESISAAEYLRSIHKIPTSNIWKETTSLDTIGNAYYLRTSYLDPAARGKFRRLAIITSDFHMPRTREIFDWILMAEPVLSFEKSSETVLTSDESNVSSSSTPEQKHLFPFKATLFGRSSGQPFKEMKSNEKHLYDVVDYYSVSDDNTMPDESVLAERVDREQASLVNFRKGIVAKLNPLRSNPEKHEEFLGAVMDFVLSDHKAYCVHDDMVKFPKKEVWMKNATY